MELNYQELGFKCGLEVHQQLEGKKMFCNCPTFNSDREADIKVERKLKAVVGEKGEIDIAAQHEMLKNKRFIYESNSEDTCLVEYDEEPPHELNKNSLETALKVALLLNAKIIDEIQIMRKTVIDGSNVSGFQRTALIAMGGFIETPQGKVSILTICLEEESAQKLEDGKDFVRYRLDRLGIPLIEIATGTEIKNPEHAKDVAAHIGMILRSVDGVKRGLGTIRQDVNISVTDGARTEIKGFQDLKSIPKVIEYEVKRQIDSIEKGKKPQKEVRKAEQDFTTSFLRPMPGAHRLYPETDVLPANVPKKHLEELKKKLPKLLSEKSEEYQKLYDINEDVAKQLLKMRYNFENLVNYSRMPVIENLQKNIQQINKMIPILNMPPIELKKIQDLSNHIKQIIEIPKIPFEEITRIQEQLNYFRNSMVYTTLPIQEAMARLEVISKLITIPKIAVRTLTNTLPEVKKEGVDIDKIEETDLKEILRLVAEDKISKEAISEILTEIDKGKSLGEIIKKYSAISNEELENEIKKLIQEKPDLNIGAYMGLVMAKHRGKVEGKKIMEMLKKYVK